MVEKILSRIDLLDDYLLFLLLLPMAGLRRVRDWVMEPIYYDLRWFDRREEIEKLLETAPHSRIEPYYLQVIARGHHLELLAAVRHLREKIGHDEQVLRSNGLGAYAEEYRTRREAILACHLQNVDTLMALEKRLDGLRG